MTVSPSISTVSKRKSGLSHGLLYPVKNKEQRGMKNASWTNYSQQREHKRGMKSLRGTRAGEIFLQDFPLTSLSTRRMAETTTTSIMNEKFTTTIGPVSPSSPIRSVSFFKNEVDSLLKLLRKEEFVNASRDQVLNQSQNGSLWDIPADICIPNQSSRDVAGHDQPMPTVQLD